MSECETTIDTFDRIAATVETEPLRSHDIDTLQVNLGFLCNQQCKHCHVDASPYRTETMDWATMELVAAAVDRAHCSLVDITGGAPELNPNFVRFVAMLRERGHTVQVRTNLTALLEPGMENVPEFLRDHEIRLVASMPCYLEENVRAQRGDGVYQKSIYVLKRLNELGYGTRQELQLNLVYNPIGPVLPPSQPDLEAEYRRELSLRYGLVFTHLLTITNMPIGRFLDELRDTNKDCDYIELLKTSFNPSTVDGLMCRHQISVAWDGTLYDCDFNLVLGMPINSGNSTHVAEFDPRSLSTREIVTGEHCYGCTAGTGSSCGGSLV